MNGDMFGVECNLSASSLKRSEKWEEPLLTNYEGNGETLQPFEARLYRLT